MEHSVDAEIGAARVPLTPFWTPPDAVVGVAFFKTFPDTDEALRKRIALKVKQSTLTAAIAL